MWRGDFIISSSHPFLLSSRRTVTLDESGSHILLLQSSPCVSVWLSWHCLRLHLGRRHPLHPSEFASHAAPTALRGGVGARAAPQPAPRASQASRASRASRASHGSVGGRCCVRLRRRRQRQRLGNAKGRANRDVKMFKRLVSWPAHNSPTHRTPRAARCWPCWAEG